jgi:Cu+-exporting ATPase
MIKNSVDISQLSEHSIMLQEQGKTTVYVAYDSEPLAILAIADTLKESSFQAVSELSTQGIDVWMITGDKEKTAKAIAKKVGIDNVMAEVMPADKAGKVKELQSKGKTVAFTGDGVNDAPALAQADVGIALGSGTDVSVETGDIVLVKNDLMDVVSGIDLGKKTVSKIKQGFFWALVYNIALLPIAAGLLVPFNIVLRPEFAGLAMSLSSVSVVTNALLLGRFKTGDSRETEITKIEEPESGIAIDPICKMEVEVATADLYSDYKGNRYYFCAPYCKTTFDQDPAKYAIDEKKEEPEVAIDPICKMDVDVETSELYSDYEGKRYYFCAPYCKQTFDANPEQYKNQDYKS